MLELNLDFLFLLKGLLAILLALGLRLSRNFSKHSATVWVVAYLFSFCVHAWLHMCMLGMQPSSWLFFLLDFTQAIAWILLAIAGAAVLHARFPAWKIQWWPLAALLLSVPLFVPQMAFLHNGFSLAAGCFSLALSGIAFLVFPPLHERFKNLQRLLFFFLLLPAAVSTLFPLPQACANCNVHAAQDFWMEAMEALSLLAAFAVLHIIFVQIGRIHPPSSAQARNFLHMKVLSASFVFTFLVGALWAHNTAVRADQEERMRLLNYLHSAKLAFSPREIALLAGTREDMNRLSYRDIKLRLQELVSVLPKARFAYLMGQRENNVIFLADSAPDDSEDASLPGQIYAEASDTLRSVLSSGQDATEGPLPDQYGVWVSAFVSIRDENRGGFAILGMDIDARDWQRLLFRTRLSPVLVTWLVSLLLLGVFLYIRKITENQERLAQSEQKYRLLFEESQDAYLLLQDTFIDCNAAAERLFACSRAEILGHYPWDFSPERQPDGRFSQKLAQQYVSQAMKGDAQRFPWIHQSCEGKTLHTEVSLHLLPMETPTLQAVIRDRTEEVHHIEQQRKMESRMAEMQKWEGLANLAGGVAHDFNNLLTNIVGNVHLAQMEPGNIERQAQCHEAILESARMATDLARQMLAYAGKGSLSVRPFPLNDVLRKMEKMLVSVAAGRARIELRLEENLPALLGDATQIQQVVFNLVINALEAIKHPDGRIEISLSQQHFLAEEMQECIFREPPAAGQYLVLRVRDNGGGIDPKVLPRIFEPFFTTKFTGRGLGLAATAGIIHNHGGAIRVHSTLGEGTEFEIRLPATNKKSESKTFVVEEEEPAAIQSLRVLVVEDEENLRQLAVRVLERQGHTAIAAADGVEGLDLARQNRGKLDIVFADVLMPRMDGIAMARKIREEFPDLPILLTSGHVPGDGSDYLSFTNGFLPKPYHYKELLKKIYETITSK